MISIASLGALVTVLSLVVDPFAQQVMGYRERISLVPSESVWTARLTMPSFFSVLSSSSPQDTGLGPEYFGTLNGTIWNEADVYERRTHCRGAIASLRPFHPWSFAQRRCG
ncbi:hypothetical protein QBC43DRAFT_354666 [Cladorrhinum sp. PSN259]|nr:hypothetical protein QBC43DRAFT_354666 [Cladorrhinum sp. PSN259]